MSREDEKVVEFFGKVTSSMTHELKNVFAIIQESSGLMGDILSLPKQENVPKKERLETILLKVGEQVQRGVTLVGHLNKLAHIPDHPIVDEDLTEMLNLIAALTQRPARLKQVKLELECGPPSSLKVRTRPVYLLAALFYTIESCLSLLGPGASITLGTHHTGQWMGFRIHCSTEEMDVAQFKEALASSPSWLVVQQTMEKLNGKANVDRVSPEIILEVKG